jgi:monothiol glutaredoxin
MATMFPHEIIQKMITENRVVIFGKGEKDDPYCGFTAQVQRVFENEKFFPAYAMVNILENEALRAEMKIFSDWPTFPQVYIDGEFIGGYDIVLEMAENGDLEKRLTEV